MNLFFIDKYLEKNANSLCDKHVVKMILETAQLLYSAWHTRSTVPASNLKPYRLTHKNHPMAIWVRECEANYTYTCYYGLLLCAEYTQRYNKYHKTEAHIRQLLQWGFPPLQNSIEPPKKQAVISYAYKDICHGIDRIPLCMDEQYYVRDQEGHLLGTESYRNYYKSKQDKFSMQWKLNKPTWF